MTFPRGYQPPKKQNNSDDKTDVTNNPNISTKNENNVIDRIPTSVGEAVKEAIETGKDVVIQGPQTAGELSGIKESELEGENTSTIPIQSEKEKTQSTEVPNDSKLEIEVIERPNDSSIVSTAEKIIVNPNESETDREANLTTVTTIPTEGVNVEAQTEFTVPLKDKVDNIEVETDVKVNPTTNASSESILESTNSEKPILTPIYDDLSPQKYPSQLEADKETINPKQVIEKEEQKLQRQQQPTNNFPSDPFITYSVLWHNIISNWMSFYDEYLKNIVKFNGLWFDKSRNERSGSQQEQ
ncbi:MAG TPA: hypothetical protein VHJ38_06975 [Nitrososphaeraceae archaeon]|nr:hypothetical protein [Nitrososphaeraceae archaeon]